jgi:hypothetical protein
VPTILIKMKHFNFLIFVVIAFISCNQPNKNKAVTRVVKEEIEQKSSTDKIDLKKLKNVVPRLVIIEYDQWKKSIETVITNDGLYRYEKNWQNGELKKEILFIESQGFYEQINKILEKDFCRNREYYEDLSGNTYFIHLKNYKTDSTNIIVSFKNCKSIELEHLISLINHKLPESEHIKLKGKNVVNNFVSADSINTWNSLKLIAKYNSLSTFKLINIDRNVIPLIDSTKFGKIINKAYSLKSSYIVAVKENIGKYYPCIVLVEKYECDDIVKSLALFMIDSTFNEIGDFEFISGYGSGPEGEWGYFGTFNDSVLKIFRKSSFECYDDAESISMLKVQSQFVINEYGQIVEIKTDTIEMKYCGYTTKVQHRLDFSKEE